jgi:hypothetical protein
MEFYAHPMTSAAFLNAMFLILILARLATLVVLIFLFPVFSQRFVNSTLSYDWPKNFLYGFLGIFLIPFLVLALIVTVVGAEIGLILGTAYVGLLLLASPLNALLLGSIIFTILLNSRSYLVDIWAAVLGLILTTLILFIPFAGPMIWLFLFILSAGGLIRMVLTRETI